MASIKRQIIARLLELAAPLKKGVSEDGIFRAIERKRTFFLLEPNKPALHLIILPEDQIGQDERGYTMQFMASWKIIVEDARDPFDACDAAEEFLQKTIESDLQLSGLVNSLEYHGDQPFTETELKPDGGTLVNYLIQYRRMRGEPTTLY